MLKCKDIPETAEQLQDGTLSFGQRLSLYFHLVMCGHCRRYISQLKMMLGMISQSDADSTKQAADSEVEKIMNALNAANESKASAKSNNQSDA